MTAINDRNARNSGRLSDCDDLPRRQPETLLSESLSSTRFSSPLPTLPNDKLYVFVTQVAWGHDLLGDTLKTL